MQVIMTVLGQEKTIVDSQMEVANTRDMFLANSFCAYEKQLINNLYTLIQSVISRWNIRFGLHSLSRCPAPEPLASPAMRCLPKLQPGGGGETAMQPIDADGQFTYIRGDI